MARIVRAGEAKDLGLRGRVSKEIISGANGSDSVTLRLVEIPIAAPDDPPRNPHSHSDCEECIHVLSGRACFVPMTVSRKWGRGIPFWYRRASSISCEMLAVVHCFYFVFFLSLTCRATASESL